MFHRATPQLNGKPESTPTGIEDAGIGLNGDGTGIKGEEEEGGGDMDDICRAPEEVTRTKKKSTTALVDLLMMTLCRQQCNKMNCN